MTLPPLANLFAVHDEDPLSLAAIDADLRASSEFAEVWQPAEGWVAASAPLPRGVPDGALVREHALAFAEGRDVVGRDFGQVAELADVFPEHLATLPGDFGFIRFRSHGAATVVRSCGGLVPFYLWRSPDRWAVSTRLGDFVRYLPDEFGLDPLVNAIWVSGRGLFPDGRTFLTTVRILDRGRFAQVDSRGEVRTAVYWHPRPQVLAHPAAATAREHAERLRTLLVSKLARDLDPEDGNLLTLSGGVDSSSLAAIAAGVVGRKVWTWSLLPDQEDELQREISHIAPLVSRFGFERTWSVRVGNETRLEMLYAAPRVVFHVVHPALCALPGLVRDAPVHVLFGGEFGDEVCGSAFTVPDWVAHTPLLSLISRLDALPLGPRDVPRWAKIRLLSLVGRPMVSYPRELPKLIRADIREQYREWFERRRRMAARDARPNRYLTMRAEEDGFVAMNWEATSALGVRRSFPFFNREVLELAFQCHPTELIGPGTKKLLRAALRDDVPRVNLERQDKGQWGSYLREVRLVWDTPLPEGLDTVICQEWHPRPPRILDLWQACSLAQMVVFVNSVRARRLERGLRASKKPSTLQEAGALAALND